jgi:hypothetical protein
MSIGVQPRTQFASSDTSDRHAAPTGAGWCWLSVVHLQAIVRDAAQVGGPLSPFAYKRTTWSRSCLTVTYCLDATPSTTTHPLSFSVLDLEAESPDMRCSPGLSHAAHGVHCAVLPPLRRRDVPYWVECGSDKWMLCRVDRYCGGAHVGCGSCWSMLLEQLCRCLSFSVITAGQEH